MSKEKQYITFSNYKKALTCQPFFIWHKLEDVEKYKDEEAGIKTFWSSLDWEFEEEDMETDSDNSQQIIAKTFNVLNNHLNDLLMKNNEYIIISGSKEDKIQKTKDNLGSGKLLINPVFEYRDALSQPVAFDTKSKIIVDIKYSKKTKRIDLVKAFYNYSIISKTIEVEDYLLYLPQDKKYRKGEIDLYSVDCIMPQKGGALPFTQNVKGEYKDTPIMDFVKSRVCIGRSGFSIANFDNTISLIENAKGTKEPIKSFEADFTEFGTNSQWNELLEYFDHPFAGINGKVVSKKQIVNETEVESIVLDTYNNLNGKGAKILFEEATTIIDNIENKKRVIWYDYEGFSLPISPIDGVGPYNQIPFQVSIIETENNIEKAPQNIIYDPLTISHDDLADMIEQVYANKADAYIVYNQGYENARNNEIANILFEAGHPRRKEIREMVDWIKLKTIDLCDLFVINSKKTLPLVMLDDQKMRYSIKNVEKHITSNNIELPRKITPYKELEVKNGGMAMELAINRALGIVGNNEWKLKVKELKKYCENDVRAMIMVFDFIKKIKM